MNNLIPIFLFIVLVVVQAKVNSNIRSERLRENRHVDIDKRTEVMWYIFFSVIIGIMSLLAGWTTWYESVLLAIFTRMVFFDLSFNLFSGRSWDYENVNSSWSDRVENSIPFKYRIALYFILWVATILLILLW